MTVDLKRRQEAGEVVQRKMIEFLLQFSPAGELRLVDAQHIAAYARRCAFDAFSDETKPS